MLKVLDELERAVGRLVGKAGDRSPDSSGSRGTAASVGEPGTGRPAGPPDQINEEAAELIRRAIKRLKSL